MSKLQMGKPINVTGTTLVPIEEVTMGSYGLGKNWWLYGAKQPAAVLVWDGNCIRVLSVQEHQFSLAELVRQVPGLESALARLACSIRSTQEPTEF
jgi:uncharacterized spore protein YtfJ